MTRDSTKNHILFDTFSRGFPVGHGVTGAGVQKTVIPASRAGSDVMAFDKEHTETSHRTVAGSSRSSDASSYYDHIELIVLVVSGHIVLLLYSILQIYKNLPIKH
jgi:hypothetical protein